MEQIYFDDVKVKGTPIKALEKFFSIGMGPQMITWECDYLSNEEKPRAFHIPYTVIVPAGAEVRAGDLYQVSARPDAQVAKISVMHGWQRDPDTLDKVLYDVKELKRLEKELQGCYLEVFANEKVYEEWAKL